VSIDFEPDDLETAVTDALTALCRQHCPEELARSSGQSFPQELWSALAEFGLFGIGTDEGIGGGVELFAAASVLGEFAVPAPGLLASTIFASHVLPADEASGIMTGETKATLCLAPLVPWPETATLWLECDGVQAWESKAGGPVEPIRTLGGEPFGKARFSRGRAFGPAAGAVAMHDMFVAGYLSGIAERLLLDTGAYVSARKQFGKFLSQFQGVSQPLGESAIRVRAARSLGRLAAHQFDCGDLDGSGPAGARMSAEKAALQTIYAAHQCHGAMGVTEDGPVFYRSRRVRQLASQKIWPDMTESKIEAAYLETGLLGATA